MRLIILLLITSACYSQPKKANTIIVKGVSFNQVCHSLLDKDYFIDKKDSSLGMIVTIPKEYDERGNIIIQVRMKDSTAIINGKWNIGSEIQLFGVNYDLKEFMKVENLGSKASPYRASWNKLNEFALSLGKPVEYEIR